MMILDSLVGLPNFLLYLGGALGFLALFCWLYALVTPYAEFRLIRQGKVAPAISLSGAVLGFVIPLASAVSHSVGFVDMLLWATVALLVQIGVFLVVQKLIPDLSEQMAQDQPASAVLLAALALGVGVVNAACMTY